MKRLTVTILSILLFLAIALSAVAVSWKVKRNNFAEGYSKLQVGDRKEKVVQLLGSPEEVTICYDPSSNDDFDRKCAEEYWYWAFMERWIVYIDKDGKVMDKINNVSF